VVLRVGLRGLSRVMKRVLMMAVRRVRVMGRLLMIATVMEDRGLLMMPACMFVMFRRSSMVLSRLFGHVHSYRLTGCW
jgi:hypothetical protein